MSGSEHVGGIIRVGRTLLVRMHGDIDDAAVLNLESAVAREVSSGAMDGVLIDVSDMLMVDSFIARVIATLSNIVRLLGADVVLVGMQPAVAITLVELGVDMEHVRTALDAERGMRLLRKLRDRSW